VGYVKSGIEDKNTRKTLNDTGEKKEGKVREKCHCWNWVGLGRRLKTVRGGVEKQIFPKLHLRLVRKRRNEEQEIAELKNIGRDV